MRTKYEIPEMLDLEFEEEDIITRSGLEEIPEEDGTGEGSSDWEDMFW